MSKVPSEFGEWNESAKLYFIKKLGKFKKIRKNQICKNWKNSCFEKLGKKIECGIWTNTLLY